MLGRRAFVVHDVRPDHGGTVEFVFDARGPGTRWLAALRARDSVDAVGPLGRPFPVPKNPSRCLLLGVGFGQWEDELAPVANALLDRLIVPVVAFEFEEPSCPSAWNHARDASQDCLSVW